MNKSIEFSEQILIESMWLLIQLNSEVNNHPRKNVLT